MLKYNAKHVKNDISRETTTTTIYSYAHSFQLSIMVTREGLSSLSLIRSQGGHSVVIHVQFINTIKLRVLVNVYEYIFMDFEGRPVTILKHIKTDL